MPRQKVSPGECILLVLQVAYKLSITGLKHTI